MDDINEFLSTDRRNFTQRGLNEIHLPQYPTELFSGWLKVAVDKQNPEPHAFALLTTTPEGFPAARMVYLRALEDDGSLVFFSNYKSAKGRQIEATGKAGALFFWPMNERQVRVSGFVERTNAEVSDAYFAARPRESQIGAWASMQSGILSSREELDSKVEEIRNRFADVAEIPRPDFWGGFLIRPTEYEFWEGRENRLHDRIRYVRKGKDWTTERLSP